MKAYKKLNKQDFLNICKNYAKSKNGNCLSTEYVSTHLNLTWQCEEKHIWNAMPSNVKSGKWCPICSDNKKLTIQDAINLSILKDGKCLSTEYKRSGEKLIWQCKRNHIWHASYNNVKSKNSWCPECLPYIGEKICRSFFEKFFGKPFNKIRPIWLKKSNGNNLELDGFNSELNIAFEYNGIQHYEIDGFFIRTKDALDKRIEDDLLKIKLCNDNNVKLIIIPYFKNTSNIKLIANDLNKILSDHYFNGKINE